MQNGLEGRVVAGWPRCPPVFRDSGVLGFRTGLSARGEAALVRDFAKNRPAADVARNLGAKSRKRRRAPLPEKPKTRRSPPLRARIVQRIPVRLAAVVRRLCRFRRFCRGRHPGEVPPAPRPVDDIDDADDIDEPRTEARRPCARRSRRARAGLASPNRLCGRRRGGSRGHRTGKGEGSHGRRTRSAQPRRYSRRRG